MKIFAERLKALRKERGLTQDDIVEYVTRNAGVSYNKGYISKWENDKVNPDISSIIPLTNLFNVSLDYLIGISDDRRPIVPEPETVLENDEKLVISKYRELNDDGKEYILVQLDNATQLPKYKKGEGDSAEQKMA